MKALPYASGTYTRIELLWDVARLAKLSQPVSKRAMEATLQALMLALQEGERVELRGFGSFRLKTYQTKARIWKNPKNGKTYKLFHRRYPTVHFKAAQAFRKLVKQAKEGKA